MESPWVNIRDMKHIDLPYVLRNELAAYPHPWKEGHFRTSLNGGDDCFVIERADRIMGHGILSSGAGEAHVLNLCVHPDAQGCGLGRRLLTHLLETAAQKSVNVVFLEVRASNQSARALYESAGFNEMGLRRNYYPDASGREDAVLMGKELV